MFFLKIFIWVPVSSCVGTMVSCLFKGSLPFFLGGEVWMDEYGHIRWCIKTPQWLGFFGVKREDFLLPKPYRKCAMRVEGSFFTSQRSIPMLQCTNEDFWTNLTTQKRCWNRHLDRWNLCSMMFRAATSFGILTWVWNRACSLTWKYHTTFVMFFCRNTYRSRGILCYVYMNMWKDTGDTTRISLIGIPFETMPIHHIFPRCWCRVSLRSWQPRRPEKWVPFNLSILPWMSCRPNCCHSEWTQKRGMWDVGFSCNSTSQKSNHSIIIRIFFRRTNGVETRIWDGPLECCGI